MDSVFAKNGKDYQEESSKQTIEIRVEEQLDLMN